MREDDDTKDINGEYKKKKLWKVYNDSTKLVMVYASTK